VRNLRRAFLLREADGLTDGQLLEAFLSDGEEAAFEALVRRHGPMVLGVCRRVLHHAHDAEDAFQATFLVLMRKAASITRRELLGAWLHGVAFRIAVRAKTMNARRRTREAAVRAIPGRDVSEEAQSRDLEALLDREVNRLPEKYRAAIVLCELQGKSRTEASRALGLAEGTLSSRLARGRDLLRKRLSRTGLVLGSGTLTAALVPQAAPAAVPPALLLTTVRAAFSFAGGKAAITGALSPKVIALAESGLKSLFLAKLKVATFLLLGVGILGAGLQAGVLAFQPDGQEGIPTRSPVRANEVTAAQVGPGRDHEAPGADEGSMASDEGLAPADPGPASAEAEEPPRVTAPPKGLHCDPFYQKYLSAGGVPVISSEKVSDRALEEAAYLVNSLLKDRPDIRQALIEAHTRFVVMHPTEKTTDFPEQRDLKPKEQWDRIRGLGDRIRNCGEENLLRLPGDPHAGESILVHQIAYAMLRDGLNHLDEDFEGRLKAIHDQAMAKGRWKGLRGSANPAEYWSDGVRSYFDCNRTQGRKGKRDRVNTREELAAYDPELFKLIDEVFCQSKWRYVPPNERRFFGG
jgi:RNA polymerase sigma factor (sigma-70 family)